MRVLAIDTATSATAVAVCEVSPRASATAGGAAANRRAAAPETALELRDDPPPGTRPRHTTQLLSLITGAMAGSRWQDIDRIAVGLGPGTFTGLRIGIATARGLALGRGLPLVGVGTLEALALPHAGPVIAVLDARRGEAFAASWDEGGALRDAPAALTPPALGELARALETPLAVGEGAIRFRDVLERAGARVPGDGEGVHRVSAVAHCRLAAELEPGPADQIRPMYLREPDAKPPPSRKVS